MKDEIKEILDKMKNYLGECHSILAYSLCGYKKKIRNDFRMCMNDIDKLLDYITNLQQENEKLKNRIEEITKIYQNESKYRTDLETKHVQLQQEIQKKNAYIKYLEEYNPKYYKGEKFYGDLREELQQRIDKAIEYIEENCIDDEFFINLTPKEKGIIEVLKILKGDDENEK